MSASRVVRRSVRSPHVCAACTLPFAYPETGVPEGDRWRVLLRCTSCGWSRTAVLDEATLEELERELDRGRAQIGLDLDRLARDNMRDYCERFIAALAGDAILPEDF